MFILGKLSLSRLDGVHPQLVSFVKELISIAPKDFRVTQGIRTAEYQKWLFQQGRTIKGPIVTNCDGYKKLSNHQKKIDGYGYAVDLCILEYKMQKNKTTGKMEKVLNWDMKLYQELHDIAKKKGLMDKYQVEWAGNWTSFQEGAHFQLINARKVPFLTKR